MIEFNQKDSITYIAVPPSPELNKALARTGYDPWEAFLEVVDNSADAIKRWQEEQGHTSTGSVYIIAKNWERDERELIVVDTGCGMPSDNNSLAHVWGLGRSSDSKTNNTTELYGVFGIGLKAATMSIATSATFTSRSTLQENFRTSVYNPELQRQQASWDIPVLDVSPGSSEEWATDKYLKGGVGTVLVLRGLHDGFPVKADQFYNRLAEKLSRIYRFDLEGKVYQFNLGRNKVVDHNVAIDPLVSKDQNLDVEWFFGGPNHTDTFDFEGHPFEIRACHTKIGHGNRRPNSLGSGVLGTYKRAVYYLRNQREIGIASGDDSGFWNMSSVSNFFVELNFLDDGDSNNLPVQTDFGKKSVKVSPSFRSFMKKKLEACVRKVNAYKVTTKSQSVEQTKREFEQIVGGTVKVQRKDSTESSDNLGEKTKSKEGEKRTYPRTTYRGKSDKPFWVDYSDGYKARVSFEHMNDPMRVDFPFFEKQTESGQLTIVINEANRFVSDLIKLDSNYSFLYKIAAGLVLSASEAVPSTHQTDFLGCFGKMVNDFTEKEHRVKSLDSEEETQSGDCTTASSEQISQTA